MSELEYAGLNTTLRLYEASMLSQSDYDTLLQMESVDRLLDYLAKTVYVVDDTPILMTIFSILGTSIIEL